VRGEADVINRHPDGCDIFLGKVGEGDYFGEIGLLQGRPRVATVRAAGDHPLELLVLGRDAFRELMNE
jgi:CRP/FNR family transcriptional regulator, cyclic AMP receptor protein